MSAPHVSPIIRVACRSVARVIQVFALYVVFHGHYSPGGGFQGGAMLAAAFILLRIGEGRVGSQRAFPSEHALLIGSLGALLYAAVGVADLLTGGAFLDYSFTPLPGTKEVYRHYWSILIIEIGVAIAVMAILVGIFDKLMEREPEAGEPEVGERDA